jgi:hypothetical protein
MTRACTSSASGRGARARLAVASVVVNAVLVASPVAGQQADARGSHAIVGAVLDSARRPVLGAEVSLEANGRTIAVVRSRANGRFEFADVPRRTMLMRVRRLGYHPYSEAVPVAYDEAPTELSVVLRAAVVDVAPVVVEERLDRTHGRLQEFYQHKRASRLGIFLERDQIERRDVSFVSDLLRSVRGVQVTSHSGVGNRVRFRGCRPMIWLNGLRVPDAEVDEVAHPADVEAIEVYLSMTGMPPNFVDHVGRCGAVAIWTSDGEHRIPDR